MKPTLLLLPGTLCDARIFRHQCRALRDVADLRALDYARLDRSGAWLDRLLGELPEQFSIAGFSLGGLWALELLRRAPQRVQRLALIASNARPASGHARRRSASQWRVWQSQGPAAVARGAKPAYFHHPSQRQRHGPLVRAMADGTPRHVARAEFAWAAARPDSLPALHDFGGPLLLVSGEHDRLCPAAWQREMQQAQPAARWVELPRVGHFVPLEAPGRLSLALRQWLQA
jgi:pimeloyl-ACP methyl ester carboxylesterase